jgi:hypothetical protein
VDLNKFSESLESIIYDFLMWVIFFPYTLWRILLNPLAMTGYAAVELNKDDKQNRFNGLSPPFFLFLCVFAAWAFSHAPTLNVSSEAAKTVAGQVMSTPQNMIFYRLIVGCAYPLLGALFYEWLTPGGITHSTFRLPFYQQAYICAPFTLIASISSSYRTLSTIEAVQWGAGLVTLAITIWFLIAQTRFFMTSAKKSFASSLLIAFGILLIGWSVGLLSALAMISNLEAKL